MAYNAEHIKHVEVLRDILVQHGVDYRFYDMIGDQGLIAITMAYCHATGETTFEAEDITDYTTRELYVWLGY